MIPIPTQEGAVLEQAQEGAVLEQVQEGAVLEQAQEGAVLEQAQEGAVEEQVLGTMSSPHIQPGPPKARVSLPLAGLGKPRVV